VEGAVGLGQQILRQQLFHHPVRGSAGQQRRDAVRDGDAVDDVHVAAVPDEEQWQERDSGGHQRHHQKRLAAEPVHDPAEQRCRQCGGGQGEERQTGEAVRVGQRLHPDRQYEQQSCFADHGADGADEEQPEVGSAENGAHRGLLRTGGAAEVSRGLAGVWGREPIFSPISRSSSAV
jgi:hypothetical protein